MISSKSISDSIAVSPQVGIGLARKTSSALWRNARIQSGSFFRSEIASTTSCESPLGVRMKYSSGSWNP